LTVGFGEDRTTVIAFRREAIVHEVTIAIISTIVHHRLICAEVVLLGRTLQADLAAVIADSVRSG
jgi:hypothetical protein